MIKKIRNSLTIRVFLLTFVLLLAVSGITYGFVAWTLPVTYVSRMDSTLEQHAEELLKELKKSTLENCDRLFARFREKYGASAALGHPDGTVTFPGLNTASMPLPDVTKENDSALGLNGEYDILSLGTEDSKRYSFSFADGGEIYYLLVTGETETVNQVTDTLLRILPGLVCLIVAVSLLTAWGYSHYLVRPVVRLSRSAKKMAGLDFTGSCDEVRNDEIGVLGKNLNDLSKKLSAALMELKSANQKLEDDMQWEREQEHRRLEFFSAVSHELKTPITVIKGQLEGMLHNVGVYRDRDKYLMRSLEVTCSMESMVTEILNISRMESAGFTTNKTSFDFSELIREQFARYMELIEQKNLDWELQLDNHLTIWADKKLMAQVVSNLLSNAVQYSPPNALLQVEVCTYRGAVLLTIENSGVHLPEEEIPRLFEAFYRVESSRSRKTGGSGLGLYLVGRILEMHGGDYWIQNTRSGVCFSFSLPRELADEQ